MKAIRYNASIPRYALAKTLGRAAPSLLWSGISCTYMDEIPPPPLPGSEWVVIKTRFGGICGSDMGMVTASASPYYEPMISMPLTMGHENVGYITEIGEAVNDWQVGDRVVVEPLLWCRPRGFDQLCRFCAAGEINRCERFTDGPLAPGMYTGTCSQTGGSWSPFFAAHKSQLYHVPDNVTDENALLVEPFACGIHAVLSEIPSKEQTILIIGAGTIGLLTLAALRQLGCESTIIVLAKYPFQAEAARKLGADSIISKGDVYAQVAAQNGARIFQPTIGKRVIRGGPDVTYECAGTDSAIDDALRLTRTGGRVILLGLPGIAKGIDWSSIFVQELRVNGSFLYHRAEEFGGDEISSFSIAIDRFSRHNLDLSWLVTHRYELRRYKQALRQVSKREEYHIVKAVFEFDNKG
jgi:threonine dehydrogenase-like Zn-dependent dehydrogenase